jgi:hypothetical protein
MSPARHGHRAPNVAAKLRTARAIAKAVDLAPIIAELRASGITSLNGIATAFGARGVLTPSGHGHWHAMQVARLLKRLGS